MLPILGGAIIGLAASILLLFDGRVTGISGITSGVIKSETPDKSWRIFFLSGLIIGGVLLRFFRPEAVTIISGAFNYDYALAGFLVGFGTVLGSGCTSGHGVCGLSRFSVRSMVAVLIFIGTAMLTLFVFKTFRGVL
ncbi:YeeE/YedE family protein [Peredibacter starrii]|uniref:YeeE/YedE thiosulfate transporter family protein n=1 Tax=Peredibacter starrii TaxID=28202 RepID=A0AAX4HTS0_9BACT|nr:YeeE/YedE thiosulfate transporter family protein [Peredibacter starrii]WPU66786.1 YeeE/YedE thiosulfate transporter family protein [Peredibacter starrii]